MSQRADPRTNAIMSGGQAYQPPTAEEERQRIARIQQGMSQDPMQQLQGMFSRPPTGGGVRELTPRQQRRQQYLERRGRQFTPNQRVVGQPAGGMPQQELTARQQRRQQYLQRQDARQQRRVDDYRAQQAAMQQPNIGRGIGMGPSIGGIPAGMGAGIGAGIAAGMGGFPGVMPQPAFPGDVATAVGGYPMDIDPSRPIPGYPGNQMGSQIGNIPTQAFEQYDPNIGNTLGQLPNGVNAGQTFGNFAPMGQAFGGFKKYF